MCTWCRQRMELNYARVALGGKGTRQCVNQGGCVFPTVPPCPARAPVGSCRPVWPGLEPGQDGPESRIVHQILQLLNAGNQ